MDNIGNPVINALSLTGIPWICITFCEFSSEFQQNPSKSCKILEIRKILNQQGLECRWWNSNSRPLGYKPSALAINSFPAIALSCLTQWLEHSVYNRGVAVQVSPWHRHPHCKFLYWYQEFLCPAEPLYFSDEKSTTVEKW